MINHQGRLVAAAGVALVATLALATGADAQERVRWKMQSAFPGNLSHLGTSGLRLEKMVERVSGGNFDFERLPDVKERALRFEGLKKYFVFRFPQRPGALRDFLELLGPDDDIARFEYLKKSARNFGSVLSGIETKDRRNFDVLAKRFHEAGWAYQDITDNETIAGLVI